MGDLADGRAHLLRTAEMVSTLRETSSADAATRSAWLEDSCALRSIWPDESASSWDATSRSTALPADPPTRTKALWWS
jgi:hypothetical protein